MGSTLISDSGTFESGVTQSSFDTNLSGKVTVITAAADTIGDVLGMKLPLVFLMQLFKFCLMGTTQLMHSN